MTELEDRKRNFTFFQPSEEKKERNSSKKIGDQEKNDKDEIFYEDVFGSKKDSEKKKE